MARIQLEKPDPVLFETVLPVRISDLNYGNHLGNDRVLTLAHEARMQFLLAKGFKNEVDIANGIGFIIADSAVVYRSEAFYGDQLMVAIGASDFNKYGFDMQYLMVNRETGKEVAIVKTGMVCFNYHERKVSGVPDALMSILKA